eukprot:TRINITY_DN3343_c0_g1_i1.p2 TRINITY_DN3343_c0_g1~~TRINITY_DN3343_c0_g1_i1.p2  ORF type:complete len:394 (+),score=80.73 TRINITY_DN3343_c0_g1_i1:1047-2228(+)
MFPFKTFLVSNLSQKVLSFGGEAVVSTQSTGRSQMENDNRYATEDTQHPEPAQHLAERLTSYSVINSLFLSYGSVKASSTLLKYGLETAESLTGTVINTLDTTLGVNLEQKGNQVLDQLEGRASYVKEESIKKVNLLLDSTENIIDGLLPPMMEIEKQDVFDWENQNQEGIIPRVTSLGYTVPRRLKAVAINKLSTLDFRNSTQLESFSYVVDLIQFAADYLDVEKQKIAILSAGEVVRETVGSHMEVVNQRLISHIKEIVDKHTEDIKNAGVKTVVGIVAAVAHAVEIVRRQLLNHFGSKTKLQEELVEYIISTKHAILSLKEHDLIEYVNVAKTNSYQALTKIMELVGTYVPIQNVPGLESFTESLVVWRDSINRRLSDALEVLKNTSSSD